MTNQIFANVLRSIAIACIGTFAIANAHGGQFGFTCRSDVNCLGLFNDLVTERFTTKYSNARWRIFVQSDVYAFGDGSGAAHATVGVTPASSASAQVIYPSKTWSHILTKAQVAGAYGKQQMEREVIRSAVEALMAKCDDSPKCELD